MRWHEGLAWWIVVNLACSLWGVYRRPTWAFIDSPIFFVIVSALLTLPIAAWEAVKGDN